MSLSSSDSITSNSNLGTFSCHGNTAYQLIKFEALHVGQRCQARITCIQQKSTGDSVIK